MICATPLLTAKQLFVAHPDTSTTAPGVVLPLRVFHTSFFESQVPGWPGFAQT